APATGLRADLEQSGSLSVGHAVISSRAILHLECAQGGARRVVELAGLVDVEAMRREALPKPPDGRQFLLIAGAGDGDGLGIRPHDQPGQRESVPGEARAGVLLIVGLYVAMTEDAIGSNAMTTLDVAYEFDDLFDLRLGEVRIDCAGIAAVTPIDDLDADRIRIQMGVTLPVTRACMPRTLVLVDEPVNRRRPIVDQIMAADFLLREPVQRPCKVEFRVMQHDELHAAVVAYGVVSRVDARLRATAEHRRQNQQEQA